MPNKDKKSKRDKEDSTRRETTKKPKSSKDKKDKSKSKSKTKPSKNTKHHAEDRKDVQNKIHIEEHKKVVKPTRKHSEDEERKVQHPTAFGGPKSLGLNNNDVMTMQNKLAIIFGKLQSIEQRVTYATFLATIYFYYRIEPREFRPFMKHIETEINVHKINISSELTKQEFTKLWMPNKQDNLYQHAPSPEEVMLLFEIIDEEKRGSVTTAEIGMKLSQIDCFLDSDWTYSKYLSQYEKYKNRPQKYVSYLEDTLRELELSDTSFLLPGDFYYMIVEIWKDNNYI